MTTNKELKIKQPLLYAIILSFGIFLGNNLHKNMQKNTSTNSKLNELVDLLQKNYVDPINTDSIGKLYQQKQQLQSDSLEDALMEQLLGNLDPHSVYIPPVDLKEINEEMKGEFAGIGVEYNLIKDTITIINVLPNGPSANAGIQIGDQLIRVNDTIVAAVKITTSKIRTLLRGSMDSEVALTIRRNNRENKIKVTRGLVQVPSIDAAYMINNKTGYIKLNKFSLNSYTEFRKALETLQKNGLQELILDLRGNGGGILGDAAKIADEFLDGNKLIVYTEGAHQKRQTYECSEKGLFETGKLVLLIDEQSASASEVLAGALQDWDRATIIGRRTFGKGLVQKQFGFSDLSGVRITVARYYTPSGRSIQKTYENGKAAYARDLENRYSHNGLTVADSNKLVNTKIYKTHNGRIVYGGGGITPDYFIGLDTSIKYFAELEKLQEKNTIANYCFSFYSANKNFLLEKFNSRQFAAVYEISATDWTMFEKYCLQDSIQLSSINQGQKNYLKDRIKQLLAKYLWQSKGLYEMINHKDEMVIKAMDLLQ